MHPRTEDLLRHLEANRAILRAAVDAVPVARRQARPAADRWSVGEILEHLSKVESQITRLIERWLTEAERAGTLAPEHETDPVAGSIDTARLLDRTRRVTASDRVAPTGELSWSEAWAALETARAGLRELVMRYDGRAIGTVMQPHPVLGPLNAYQWLVFIGAHEARHAQQIAEIGAA